MSITKIDFSFSGGMPFDQSTLNKMQGTYYDFVESLLRLLNVPETGNHVLYGCVDAGGNISAGIMYIDGDICAFAGASGDGTTKIKKDVTLADAAFENGTNNPVYRSTAAVVDAAGAALSTFARYSFVTDGNYVHTDNNFTAALLAKLNGIQAGAEVNVQADWNQTDNAQDDFIKNKPVGMIQAIGSGQHIVGNLTDGTDTVITVTIQTGDVGTNNYQIDGSFEGLSTNPGNDNDFTWIYANKTTTTFQIIMKQTVSNSQYIKFYYKLFAN